MGDTNTIDFKDFCAKVRTRYDFEKPFVVGKYKVATDGRIFVFAPTIEPATLSGRYPNPDNTLAIIDRAIDVSKNSVRPVPTMMELGLKLCPKCLGEGRVKVECKKCGGKHDWTCEHCGSTIECDKCDDDGFVSEDCQCPPKSRRFKFDGHEFHAKYLPKLEKLPNLLARVARGIGAGIDKSDFAYMYFKFDGGGGVLMEVKATP